ncbi:MAG: STAS domain-containing protein [Boseongicola sp.]|nr:STAS domain-containing protein [Boseongicola sp.]
MPERPAAGGEDPLFSYLKERLNSPVCISMRDVSRMDALRLQILLAAQCQWLSDAVAFTVTEISKSCAESLVLLGLEPDHFEMDIKQ